MCSCRVREYHGRMHVSVYPAHYYVGSDRINIELWKRKFPVLSVRRAFR